MYITPHVHRTPLTITYHTTPQEYKLLHPVQVNADTRQQAKGVRRVKNDQSKGTTRHSQPRGDDVKVAVQPVIDGAKPLLHTPSSGVAR